MIDIRTLVVVSLLTLGQTAAAEEKYGLGPVQPEADMTVRDISTALYKLSPGEKLDYSGRDLTYLDLSGLDFKAAVLRGSDFYGTDFTDASLKGADLTKCRLDRAVLIRADLSGADLTDATILRPTIYSDLSSNPKDAPHFAGARLARVKFQADLSGSDFRGAEMTEANFSPLEPRPGQGTFVTKANECRSCDFSGATLVRANMTEAQMAFASFKGADLRDAIFAKADLAKSDFSGADLTGADLSEADLDSANLAGAKGLDRTRGLETARNLEKAFR